MAVEEPKPKHRKVKGTAKARSRAKLRPLRRECSRPGYRIRGPEPLQYGIFPPTRLLYNSAFELSSPHVGVIPVLFPAPRHDYLNQQRLRDVPI